MNPARLKYAVLLAGLLAPLGAHAEMGDPSPELHGDAMAAKPIDVAPVSAIDTTPTGSIQGAAPCEAHKHGQKKKLDCAHHP
jgi:hypothetical protein